MAVLGQAVQVYPAAPSASHGPAWAGRRSGALISLSRVGLKEMMEVTDPWAPGGTVLGFCWHQWGHAWP